MTSLGTSPINPPSLLIPPNPAFTAPENHPKGGILLNGLEVGVSPPHISHALPSPSPTSEKGSALGSTTFPGSGGSPSSAAKGVPRIRFAPLPDPRPRSLSTGRNLAWTNPGMDGDGNERHIEIRGVEPSRYGTDDEDNENAVEDDDYDEGGGSERDKRGRSWSKTMSWKGTKALLTTGKLPKESEAGYASGAPLTKSTSTGGMIGSWSIQEDRRRSMQGVGTSTTRSISPGSAASGAHRRNSSMEQPLSATPSPRAVKLLNGRVYGSRRASEIAEMQKRNREKNEPAFVEWGHGKAGGGLGSNAPKTAGGGFLEEEGSGMEWVKRRREERQKKEKEEKERKEREAAAAAAAGNAIGDSNAGDIGGVDPLSTEPRLSSSQSSGPGDSPAVTPALKNTELPPTPVIQVHEPDTPGASAGYPSPSAITSRNGQDGAATTPAINIASTRKARESRGDESAEEGGDEDDGEEEEEDDDDGDFSDDDEEEEDAARTTVAAAGIEVFSGHKDHTHVHSHSSPQQVQQPQSV